MACIASFRVSGFPRLIDSGTIHFMRRWLAIFLLVLLPFQFAWSMAAAYCQHEAGTASQHFGHHEHKHLADLGTKDAKGSLSNIDNDCVACHASCTPALTGAISPPSVVGVESDYFYPSQFETSLPRGLPERPNWPFLA